LIFKGTSVLNAAQGDYTAIASSTCEYGLVHPLP
jgi:hypothetical protein